jgi:hypothetical protein
MYYFSITYFNSIFPYTKLVCFLCVLTTILYVDLFIILPKHATLLSHLILIDLISLPALCEAEASCYIKIIFPSASILSLHPSYDELSFSASSNPTIWVSCKVRELVSLLCETANWTAGFWTLSIVCYSEQNTTVRKLGV